MDDGAGVCIAGILIICGIILVIGLGGALLQLFFASPFLGIVMLAVVVVAILTAGISD